MPTRATHRGAFQEFRGSSCPEAPRAVLHGRQISWGLYARFFSTSVFAAPALNCRRQTPGSMPTNNLLLKGARYLSPAVELQGAAARVRGLHRWTGHRAIRTKNAAVTGLRLECGAAGRA